MNFLPLDIRDEDDIALVLQHADYILQYGEDLEPKQPKDEVSAILLLILLGARMYVLGTPKPVLDYVYLVFLPPA